MCILLNYCPSKALMSGQISVERKTILAASRFFEASASIEELFKNVELLVQFPDLVQDTEKILDSAIEKILESIDLIQQSRSLSATFLPDSTKKPYFAVDSQKNKSAINQHRAYANLNTLGVELDTQVSIATTAYTKGEHDQILIVAVQKLGSICDDLVSVKGKTKNIESMTGVFSRLTKSVFDYKVYSFFVSQSYKAISSSNL